MSRGPELQRLRLVVDRLMGGEPLTPGELVDAGVDLARLELQFADVNRALAREREACAKVAESKGAHLTAHAIRKAGRLGR